jgi:hypothetical protein
MAYSSLRVSSADLRSVRSTDTPMTAVNRPSSSKTGVLLTATGNRLPLRCFTQ